MGGLIMNAVSQSSKGAARDKPVKKRYMRPQLEALGELHKVTHGTFSTTNDQGGSQSGKR